MDKKIGTGAKIKRKIPKNIVENQNKRDEKLRKILDQERINHHHHAEQISGENTSATVNKQGQYTVGSLNVSCTIDMEGENKMIDKLNVENSGDKITEISTGIIEEFDNFGLIKTVYDASQTNDSRPFEENGVAANGAFRFYLTPDEEKMGNAIYNQEEYNLRAITFLANARPVLIVEDEEESNHEICPMAKVFKNCKRSKTNKKKRLIYNNNNYEQDRIRSIDSYESTSNNVKNELEVVDNFDSTFKGMYSKIKKEIKLEIEDHDTYDTERINSESGQEYTDEITDNCELILNQIKKELEDRGQEIKKEAESSEDELVNTTSTEGNEMHVDNKLLCDNVFIKKTEDSIVNKYSKHSFEKQFLRLKSPYASISAEERTKRNLQVQSLKCPEKDCSFEASVLGSLKNHIQVSHKKYILYQCRKCSTSFLNLFELREHMRSYHNLKMQQHVDVFNDYAVVVNRNDYENATFETCKGCNRKYYPGRFHYHLEKCLKKPKTDDNKKNEFCCPHCSFKTLRQFALGKHLKYIHKI